MNLPYMLEQNPILEHTSTEQTQCSNTHPPNKHDGRTHIRRTNTMVEHTSVEQIQCSNTRMNRTQYSNTKRSNVHIDRTNSLVADIGTINESCKEASYYQTAKIIKTRISYKYSTEIGI